MSPCAPKPPIPPASSLAKSIPVNLCGVRDHVKMRSEKAFHVGFALTDPGMRLSRTRPFPEVTRIRSSVASRDE